MKNLSHYSRRIPRKGLVYSVIVCGFIITLGGFGFTMLEPKVLTLSDGLWLAFTTAATVGYGDIVPSTTASRAFAIIVVLLGLAVLSLVTASVSAIFVEAEEREFESELVQQLKDLHHQLRGLRNEVEALRELTLSLQNNAPARPTPYEPLP
jgi:voltage-gated potassium channel